jgi:hypothetical protein
LLLPLLLLPKPVLQQQLQAVLLAAVQCTSEGCMACWLLLLLRVLWWQ